MNLVNLFRNLFPAKTKESTEINMHYTFTAYDAKGNLKWSREFDNLVVMTGRNELLNNTFDTAASGVNWYIGLKGAGTVAAGDTMASHSGWSEITNYDESARPAWTKNAASSTGSMSNSSAKAVFTINAPVTVAGALMTNNSTKGGSTGTLFGAGDFASARSLEISDVLNVQVDPSVTAS